MPEQFIQKPGLDPATGIAYAPSNLLTTINPATGKPFSGLQEASDLGGYVPVANPASVIGIDESNNQLSQGSDDQRDTATDLQNQLDQLGGDDRGVDTAGVDLGAEFEKLKQQSANIGLTAAEELAQIESAGTAAGAEYDPLISGAQERARMGQAVNIVATGRRGGFQRARYAGEAALGPTVGDVGYEGAGGKLEASASAYQRNIDALKSQRMRAIELAKAQARKAIRTGKQQDFTNAASMLDFARQMDADAKKAEQDMFDNLFKMKQEERAESAESRAQTTADFNIVKDIAEGESITIGNKIFTGIKKENIEPFWTSASLVSLMKELPEGETQDIVDPMTGSTITITGLKSDEPNTQVFKSVNQNTGTETFTTIDTDTGEIINQKKSVGTGQVFKYTSKDTDDDKSKNEFFTDLNKGSDELRTGKSWGATYNTLYAKYKTGDAAQDAALTQLIDSSLDKDFWSTEGAYQEFKRSTLTKTVLSMSYNEDGSKTIIYTDGSRETVESE